MYNQIEDLEEELAELEGLYDLLEKENKSMILAIECLKKKNEVLEKRIYTLNEG